MSDPNADVMKEYRDAGVDLPELAEQPKPEEKPEPAKVEAPKEEEAPAKPEGEHKPEDEAPSQPPEPPRKRSIYDDLKETRNEKKEALTRAEQAEKERDELKTKLDALSKAETPTEKKDAQDEIDAFMSSHKEWDKAALQDLVSLARKGIKPEIPQEIVQDLEEFKKWKAENGKAIEAHQFEKEFTATIPSLKEMFPNISDDELKTVRTELDKLAHTKEYHDKDLSYVAFMNRSKLSTLVSPKKKGIEPKGRVDNQATEFEFDPNADYSKMTPAEREKWEAEYAKATSSEGLLTDSNGRKSII